MISLSACASKTADKLVTGEHQAVPIAIRPPAHHLDETAAERTPLKGLAASGWHTAAIAMRLIVDARPLGPHPLFGAGVDDLRWLAPVRPGGCDPPRRRGNRTHTIKDEATGNCTDQMDGLQSAWRPRLHRHSNRLGAASPERIEEAECSAAARGEPRQAAGAAAPTLTFRGVTSSRSACGLSPRLLDVSRRERLLYLRER